MTVEESLQSIQRWLMLIALLLTIRVYYLASNGYNDAAGDADDNVIGLFALILGVLILLALGSSYVKTETERTSTENGTSSK